MQVQVGVLFRAHLGDLLFIIHLISLYTSSVLATSPLLLLITIIMEHQYTPEEQAAAVSVPFAQ